MKIVLLILLCCSLYLPAQVGRMTLTDNWQFRQKGKETYYTAKVPGTVHTDLMRAGLIDDPFYGTNEAKVQWVEQEDWEYATDFVADDKLLKRQHIELLFDGLDTYARVFLNGQLILSADNMFRHWAVDIRQYLKPGKNHLKIMFESAVKKGKAAAGALPYTLPGEEKVFTRKAQYQYGWDWGPRLVTCGIYKPVYINYWDDLRLKSLGYFIKELNDNRATVGFITETESSKTMSCELDLHLALNDTSLANTPVQSYTARFRKGIHRDTFYHTIGKPQLWYTNGLGKANLYHAALTIRTKEKQADRKKISIGLRRLELVREKDVFGESFFFRLNGIPVFMKGANYIPQHSFVTELKAHDYDSLVTLARDANMNMLRVWGGGLYEDDAFYEQCDRKGVLVWQDFMFACAMYPGDKAFVENVKEEVLQQAQRLRNHACLALWCGNNEIDEGWHNWGWKRQYQYSVVDSSQIWNDYKHLFHEVIPQALKQADPQTAYWPSSPSIGWGHAESLLQGDAHYWGVWWGMMPFDLYEKKTGRFMSEYGFQGMPSLSLFNTFCKNDELSLTSDVVKTHQKHSSGYQTIREYMERDYKVPADFEKYIYVSQLLQRDAMKIAIEAHRRAKPYCMGTLYWQLNDCWPVTSWSALDHRYGRKALFFETKKLYSDVCLSVHKNRADYEVFIISDKRVNEKASFSMTLRSTKGDTLLYRQDTALIEANSSAVHARLSESDLEKFPKNQIYLSCTLRDQKEAVIAENRYFFVKPKDLHLYEPGLSIVLSEETHSLTITAKHFVKDLYLFSKEQGLHFSDNFIDIEPGRPVKLKLSGESRNLKVPGHFSLYDSGISK